jgi:hypothetical protein
MPQSPPLIGHRRTKRKLHGQGNVDHVRKVCVSDTSTPQARKPGVPGDGTGR